MKMDVFTMEDADGAIHFEDEYSRRPYVTINSQSKEMTLHADNYSETHPIGELLIDFVTPEEDKFDFYEEDRQELIQNLYLVDASALDHEYNGKITEFDENYIKEKRIDRDDFAKKVAIYDFVKRFEEVHPYFRTIGFYSTILPTGNDTLLNDFLNMEQLREKALEIIRFCLDMDTEKLNRLEADKRYYYYFASGRGRIPLDFKSRIITIPDKIPMESYPVFYKPMPKDFKARTMLTVASLSDLKTPQEITDDTIDFLTSQDIQIHEAFEVDHFSDIVYLEFFQMILNNISVKKCELCGRYFVRKGEYGGKYCDRILRGYKQTCQQIGSTRDYNQRNNRSETRQEYMRAYKRMHSRIKYGMLTREDFKKWNMEANAKMLLCDSSELSLEEFKKWLGNK
jgi:hypothetical protein